MDLGLLFLAVQKELSGKYLDNCSEIRVFGSNNVPGSL
jgi:hypothetical protein